jgi:hypothetical protein
MTEDRTRIPVAKRDEEVIGGFNGEHPAYPNLLRKGMNRGNRLEGDAAQSLE